MSFLKTSYQHVEDKTLRATTSTEFWVTAATMTTPKLASGTYRLEFTAEFMMASNARSIHFQVLIDGEVVEDVEDTSPSGKFTEFGSYITVPTLIDAKIIELRFRVGTSGSALATVRNATLEIFRTI
jgi:hypothetical protein